MVTQEIPIIGKSLSEWQQDDKISNSYEETPQTAPSNKNAIPAKRSLFASKTKNKVKSQMAFIGSEKINELYMDIDQS